MTSLERRRRRTNADDDGGGDRAYDGDSTTRVSIELNKSKRIWSDDEAHGILTIREIPM